MKLLLVISATLLLAITISAQIGGTAQVGGTTRMSRIIEPENLPSARFGYVARDLPSCVPGAVLSTFPDSTALHNDATASGSLRPTTQVVGERCAVYYDGVNDTMVIPNTVTQNTRNTTLFMVIYPDRVYAIESPIGLLTHKVVPLSFNGQWTFWGDSGITPFSVSPEVTQNYVGPNVVWPHVMMLQHTATGTVLRLNGVDYTGPAIASATLTGGTLGQFDNDSAWFKGYQFEMWGFESIPDETRDALYTQFLNAYRPGYSATQNLIVTIGSSNTLGLRATTQPKSYPGKLIDLLNSDGKPYQIYNDALNGYGLGAMQNRFAAYVTPKYSASRSKNIAIIAVAAYADLSSSQTGAQVYANLTTMISNLQATGYTVIVTTQTPSAFSGWTAPIEAQRVNFNNAVRANAAGANCTVDTDAVASLSDPTNLTYFYKDGAEFDGHLTDAGLAVLAQTIHDICTF